ncbi:MAG: metallophosphoesterase family protein [Verrucomicrobia bacterium]|nr:metallophosphoesterase family protein [Verrucomicrobiota bacterium]
MRFALFGDIHANLEALEAVLADAAGQGVTHHVCLGDIVGYNADPVACLEKVRAMGCPVVKGNHDDDASNNRSLETLSPVAATAMEWTRQQLDDEQKQWLRKLRMVRQIEDFTVVHSTLDEPGNWGYVFNNYDAMANFPFQYTQVCFHGHTHKPKVFVKSAQIATVPADTVTIEPGMKYFINAGSVGQPRDGDWRACYAIYDPALRLVVFRRVEYDIAKAQEKILAAGLPERLAERLAEGA